MLPFAVIALGQEIGLVFFNFFLWSDIKNIIIDKLSSQAFICQCQNFIGKNSIVLLEGD